VQVRLDDLEDCRIFIGASSESVWMRNCKNCKVTVACKEFRTFDTTDCEVHVLSMAAPVVEKSSGTCDRPPTHTRPSLRQQHQRQRQHRQHQQQDHIIVVIIVITISSSRIACQCAGVCRINALLCWSLRFAAHAVGQVAGSLVDVGIHGVQLNLLSRGSIAATAAPAAAGADTAVVVMPLWWCCSVTTFRWLCLTGIYFHPFNGKYELMKRHFAAAHLDIYRNQFMKVRLAYPSDPIVQWWLLALTTQVCFYRHSVNIRVCFPAGGPDRACFDRPSASLIVVPAARLSSLRLSSVPPQALDYSADDASVPTPRFTISRVPIGEWALTAADITEKRLTVRTSEHAEGKGSVRRDTGVCLGVAQTCLLSVTQLCVLNG
jgi:hypothetical protein